MREYLHAYGVDLAYELQTAIKFAGLVPRDSRESASVINLDGNLLLTELVKIDERPRYLRLENKFDYLSNGKSKTGYHTLQDLHHLSREEEYDIVTVNYTSALDAFKATDNALDFVERVMPGEVRR